MKKLRIGFLSTAGIGRKNWKAIYNSGNAIVSAVASRDVDKSLEFIDECQQQFPFAARPLALGSYAELLASPEVDAVYIPLPTGLRQEWVLRAAKAGKHVICEKPCAVDSAGLEKMISACKKYRVQFMDGVMFMHNPRLPEAGKYLRDGNSLGEVRRISSAFTFYGGGNFVRENIRADGALEPAGCLGDLGWYSIRFTLWAMDWKMPRAATGKIHSQSPAKDGRVPAPLEFSGELIYDGGVSAGFYCSFRAASQQWVTVGGTKGCLHMPDFVHPFNSREPSFQINRREICVKTPGAKKSAPVADAMEFGHATAQDTRMWRNFARQVSSGTLNRDWPVWALKTQQVLDTCLEAARRGTVVQL